MFIDKYRFVWKNSKLHRLQMELKRLEKIWMWWREGERIMNRDDIIMILNWFFTWFWGYFCDNILREDQNGIYTGPSTDGVCSPCPADSNNFCKTNYFLRIVFKNAYCLQSRLCIRPSYWNIIFIFENVTQLW